MSNIDKNSHCSPDNRNVSCFLWEFCLLYMMWCLSNKNAETNQEKGQPDTSASLFLDILIFFFSRKISVAFEFASLLLHLVGHGDGGYAKINSCKLFYIWTIFICLIYKFWFYKSRFDMKKTLYLITIVHPTSIFA